MDQESDKQASIRDDVWNRYKSGQKVGEIAKALDRSPARISQLIKKMALRTTQASARQRLDTSGEHIAQLFVKGLEKAAEIGQLQAFLEYFDRTGILEKRHEKPAETGPKVMLIVGSPAPPAWALPFQKVIDAK